MRISIIILLLIFSHTLCANGEPWLKFASVQAPKLNEISGMTTIYNAKGFWVHNDSGDSPSIYAISKSGNLLSTVLIKGAKAKDWEDVASFNSEGKRYLLIGDVGDNKAKRPFVTLYAILEPPVSNNSTTSQIELAWSINLRYPGGPRDVESIAVDSLNNTVLLLSKRTGKPILYSCPLRPFENKSGQYLAKEVASFEMPKLYYSEHIKINKGSYWPTAMDLNVDSSNLAILTYRSIVIFSRDGNQKWSSVFTSKPRVIRIPDLRQSESLCYDKKGDLIISSEKLPVPMYRLSNRYLSK
jgi:hypothetical protein